MKQKKRLVRAIRFSFEGNERQVMNYSSIGDKAVQEWFESMHAMDRPPVIKVERGAGHQRRFECIVMDEAFLKSSARANGFEIIENCFERISDNG